MTNDQANTTSPWHSGERSLHERLGTAEKMEQVGRRVIRDHMPDQHRQFFTQLPFMVAGAVDANGDVWATVLEGEPGFMQSPDPRTLTLRALPGVGDPVHEHVVEGAAVGLLGIELHTRRRNRLNGHVLNNDAGGFTLQVGESFGNCPKYIQKRQFSFARPPQQPYTGVVERLTALDAEAIAFIRSADTFFIASSHRGDAEHPIQSVDVSHRGGQPGFVRVEGDTLHIPDFVGNGFFSTFGNLLTNPRAGLVFIDFSSGDLLQLSGHAEVDFGGAPVEAFQGAERLWTFRVDQLVRRRSALALRWDLSEAVES